LSKEEKGIVEPALLQYAHLFHDEFSNGFKGSDVVEHNFDGRRGPIKGHNITFRTLRGEMKSQIENMLIKG
jgi:hypothetical protein